MSGSTPNPKVSAAKAYVGSAIAAVVATLGVIATALDDNAISAQEGTYAAIAGLLALGGVFGGVYATTNKPLR